MQGEMNFAVDGARALLPTYSINRGYEDTVIRLQKLAASIEAN